MRYHQVLAVLATLILCGCAQPEPVPPRPLSIPPELTECTEPRPEMCTMDYQPVCGMRDTGVRCVTKPCPAAEWKTYSNGCSACSDPTVSGYHTGSCDHSAEGSSADQ